MAHPSAFGRYLRDKREREKMSLRKVAARLEVSHVYLGEVERGVRGPLPEKYWNQLVQIIPGLTIKHLRRMAILTKPIRFNLAEAEPPYQDLTLAFARRMEKQDLSPEALSEILKLLEQEVKDE